MDKLLRSKKIKGQNKKGKDNANPNIPKGGRSKGGQSIGGQSRGGQSKGGQSKGGQSRGGQSKGGQSKGGQSRGGQSPNVDSPKRLPKIVDTQLAAKQEKASKLIQNMIDDYRSSGVLLSKLKIQKIIDVIIAQKIMLPASVLDALYDHKKNVSIVMPYIEPRLMTFFEAKKMVPARGDKLFQIKLANLCVKIKKDKLQFEDDEVMMTEQFIDMDALKYSCKLYVWNIKINQCANYNTLDENDMKFKYNPELERLCNIANVPIKRPPGMDKNKDPESTDQSGDERNSSKSSEGEEGEDGEEGEKEKEEGEEGSEEGEKEKDEGADEGEKDKGGDEGGGETTEEFTENIVENFTDKDYNYIVGTSLFILVLFIIYIKYQH